MGTAPFCIAEKNCSYDFTKLRALREAAGHSRPTLASRSGLATATITAYENGKGKPSAESLGRLAAALDCAVDAFYYRPVEDADTSAMRRMLGLLASEVERLERDGSSVRTGAGTRKARNRQAAP